MMDYSIDVMDIQERIITLRGVQVMLDRDLAELYGVQTKRLNEQVKRNAARFPRDYMFALSDTETQELVAKCDRFKTMKHSTLKSSHPQEETDFLNMILRHSILNMGDLLLISVINFMIVS